MKFNRRPNNASFSYTSQNTRPTSRRKKLLMLVLVLAAGLVVWSVGKTLLKKNAEGLAGDFVSAVVANNADKAYRLTSPSFRLNTTPETWHDTVGRISQAYTGKPQLDKRQRQDVPAGQDPQETIYYKVAGKATNYQLQVNVIQIDGKWYVGYFDATVL